MTTAKRSAGKREGKSGRGKQSPPSSAPSEQQRKDSARGKGGSSRSRIPKIGKSDAETGKRGGGQLH
ncbi:MAG TPA: hypothetical protein VE842_06485 [Pyrinomonadaceae bacterium]|jgi:hypothetical protein|nr:hypothetical protein [Pyrinomonadaceae bacterium]